MNPTPQICDPNRLEDFLQERLSEQQEADLTSHLDECSTCKTKLEELAAEPASWRKASEVLGFVFNRSRKLRETACADSQSNPFSSPANVRGVLAALAPTDDPQMLGRIGPYEVSGVIGAGGMGVVLKAFDPSLDRIVAIKVMAPHLASTGTARKRFAREAKAAAAVLHPNVIAIHGVSNDDQGFKSDQSLPYLVMPYVRGTSLQKRIDNEGPLPLIDILRIGSQVAAGLAAASAQGLIHRDIKPANILLEDGVERITITDFGLARAIDDATMTHSGVIAGTPQYMSPEQARGETLDHRSDLFSLGSVLYTLCTGRPPFRAETTYGVIRRICDDDPAPIRDINPDVPAWLCGIVSRLMSKQADDRFASAEEVNELLENCLAHVQQPNSIALPPGISRLEKHMVRQPFFGNGIAILTVALAFSIFAMGSFLFLNFTRPQDIAGRWTSDAWGQVELEEIGPGQYAGNFAGGKETEPGKLKLKWSRIERRYNGDWQVGTDYQGKISIHRVKNEIRGAWRANRTAQKEMDVPAMSELVWKQKATSRNAANQNLSAAAHAESEHANHAEAIDDESHQYLVWEDSDSVRLSHWFAKAIKLKDQQLDDVNTLLSETWNEYIGLERQHTKFSTTPEGHRKAVVQAFPLEQGALDYKFWTKLDEIIDGKQQENLHALSTIRGDSNGDDSWSKRPKAFPSILGWRADWYPAEIEIWKKGTWFQWRVGTRQNNIGPGNSPSLPPELRHFWRDHSAKKSAEAPSPDQPNRLEIRVAKLWKEGDDLPPGSVLHSWKNNADKPEQLVIDPEVAPILGRNDIASVQQTNDSLEIRLTEAATKKFGEVTSRLLLGSNDVRLAVLIDGELKTSPRLIEPITAGRLQLTGNFSRLDLEGMAKLFSVDSDDNTKETPRSKTESVQLVPQVIDNFMRAALRGDTVTASALVKNIPVNQIAEIADLTNLKSLTLKTVWANNPDKPIAALAISEEVTLNEKDPDGQRTGVLVFTVTLTEGVWLIEDIDFESKEGVAEELKRFFKANPKAFGVPVLDAE